jgi:hypothetical protein
VHMDMGFGISNVRSVYKIGSLVSVSKRIVKVSEG